MATLIIPTDCPDPRPVIANHLARRIEGFQVGKHRPNGLLAYWRQPTNRQRLAALPPAWRQELQRRVEQQVERMNEAGPY